MPRTTTYHRVKLPLGRTGLVFQGSHPPRIQSNNSPLGGNQRPERYIGQYVVRLITPVLEISNFDTPATLMWYLRRYENYSRTLIVSSRRPQSKEQQQQQGHPPPLTFRVALPPSLIGVSLAQRSTDGSIVIERIEEDSPVREVLEEELVLDSVEIPGESKIEALTLTVSEVGAMLLRTQEIKGRVLVLHRETQEATLAPSHRDTQPRQRVLAEQSGNQAPREMSFQPTIVTLPEPPQSQAPPPPSPSPPPADIAEPLQECHPHSEAHNTTESGAADESDVTTVAAVPVTPTFTQHRNVNNHNNDNDDTALAVPVHHSMIGDAPMALVSEPTSSSSHPNPGATATATATTSGEESTALPVVHFRLLPHETITVQYDIESPPSSSRGQETLLTTTLTGPGTLWIKGSSVQVMVRSNMMDERYTTPNNNNHHRDRARIPRDSRSTGW